MRSTDSADKRLDISCSSLYCAPYTWKYTWGINNFCQYGADGKHADSLFKAEQKTLKEALQDCVAAHLDKIKAAQNKSATEQDFL